METSCSRLLIIVVTIILLLSCENSDGGFESSDGSGKGGSMARFTIAKNHLYTVDNYKLNVFSVATAESPAFIQSIPIGFNIETIFAHKNNLFLGSQFGMYIYDITTPSDPFQLSYFQHIFSCDPVVANDTLAYLTMRTETTCGRNTNELQVIDIRNPQSPKFVSRVIMTKPYGLGLDGKNLFVCDNGLKIFSLQNPLTPVLYKNFNIQAVDVIPDNNLLMVLAADGLHQYKYQNDTVTFLSHLQ